MTIDEVIEHAKELARTSENNQSAAKYIQLTEWLRRARGAEKASRWYTERIRKLEAKNAKLREYVTTVANDAYAMDMFDCGCCRFFEQCYNDEPKEHKGFGCQWRLWARELGIEVAP